MKPKRMFVTLLLVVDTFLVSYAVGFNSRQVLVVDPSLSPVGAQAAEEVESGSDHKADAAKNAAGKEKDSGRPGGKDRP